MDFHNFVASVPLLRFQVVAGSDERPCGVIMNGGITFGTVHLVGNFLSVVRSSTVQAPGGASGETPTTLAN